MVFCCPSIEVVKQLLSVHVGTSVQSLWPDWSQVDTLINKWTMSTSSVHPTKGSAESHYHSLCKKNGR